MKSLSDRARTVAVCLAWTLVLSLAPAGSAQTNYYSANGTEYPIIGPQLGDQVFPDVAVSPNNGIVVWQDNNIDGNGWGIGAQRLDGTLSGTMQVFRVNNTVVGDQERPRVALLKNGGAVVVWEGGVEGYQHIFGRILTPTNTFLTSTDLTVSAFSNTNSFQVNPAVAVLNNSNIVVVWSSFNQAGSNTVLDVYAKILSPSGTTVSNEFLVNQFTTYNQRSPAVAALAGGGFVVTWVSEQETTVAPNLGDNTSSYTSAAGIVVPSVGIYARLYRTNGAAAGNEFLVNTDSNPCSNPSVAAGSDGGFMLTWAAYNTAVTADGWDIYARPFSSAGVGGTTVQLNTFVLGNQYEPRLACIGVDYEAMWTSLGQDGSREGVYGQFIHNNGALVGGEFLVNTTTLGSQMQQVVASDGVSQFVAVWTSYTGSPYSFDLFAQRYLNVASILEPMAAPFVWAPFMVSNNVYQPQLVVSWPYLPGLSVADYEVYVDGAVGATTVVTNNTWTMTAANGLSASSTHSFQLDYVTTDGRRSPISPAASGTTWGGLNWGGIPSEWMVEYYGSDISDWPAPGSDVGANTTLYQVFLTGGDPLDPGTWLHNWTTQTAQGTLLNWNTQPGATYQVQVTTDFRTWNNFGSPRFAAGTTDSVNVGSGPVGFYRLELLR